MPEWQTVRTDRKDAMAAAMEYFLAPMAGYTDLPMRRICRRFGLYYGTTALVDAGALVHANPDCRTILHRGKEDEWLQVQLLGSIPTDIRMAVRLLREHESHFDALDFNMGCPVRKVLRRVAGAALMTQPVRALECLAVMRDEWPGRLTVKMRILKEDDPAPTVELARKLEAAGVDGLTIHGRLARMVYSGPVHGEIIRAVREAVHIPVTANGGIFDTASAQALVQATGCSRLMVARGVLCNPWIFRSLNSGCDYRPERAEVLDTMCDHVAMMVGEYGETSAMILARKVISDYIHGRGFHHELRAMVVKLSTWQEFSEFVAVLRKAPVLT